MLRQQPFARIALPAVSASVLLLAGCGATISGNPVAAPGDNILPTTTKAPGKPSGKPTPGAPPTTRADKGGNTDFQANIGDCVKLGGTNDDATIASAVCGSQQSNYKVTGKAPRNAQCSKDSDQAYYETLNGVETGALCLTIDWVVGDCLELGHDDPARIPCTTTDAVEGIRVDSILQNTSSVDDCPGSDQGFEYSERRFVVCVSTL